MMEQLLIVSRDVDRRYRVMQLDDPTLRGYKVYSYIELPDVVTAVPMAWIKEVLGVYAKHTHKIKAMKLLRDLRLDLSLVEIKVLVEHWMAESS